MNLNLFLFSISLLLLHEIIVFSYIDKRLKNKREDLRKFLEEIGVNDITLLNKQKKQLFIEFLAFATLEELMFRLPFILFNDTLLLFIISLFWIIVHVPTSLPRVIDLIVAHITYVMIVVSMGLLGLAIVIVMHALHNYYTIVKITDETKHILIKKD
jgi:hypothetical protein